MTSIRGPLGELAEEVAMALRGALGAELADRGTAAAVRTFLGVNLSPVFGVKHGIVVGERGTAEPMFECLLVEPRHSPAMPLLANGAELVPADAVYGAVETTDDLSQETLAVAAARIAALKRVQRLPLFKGDELVNPYLGLLVARGGLTGSRLLDAVASENDARPFEEQIDLVCVLDHGLLGHAEVAPEGAVSLDLALQASPRWRLTWLDLGERTLLGFYLALWESLQARTLRPSRLHVILRSLRSGGALALPAAHGIDRGE
jgi:hypothetical protein